MNRSRRGVYCDRGPRNIPVRGNTEDRFRSGQVRSDGRPPLRIAIPQERIHRISVSEKQGRHESHSESPVAILMVSPPLAGVQRFLLPTAHLKLRISRMPTATFADTTVDQRRTLLAASLGWMLDAFDAMLYALVLTHIMRDLGMSKATSGFLATLTLLASGIGGVLFGFIADRIGRKRALMLSILTYSLCSFASGLSTSILMLAIFRFILGLGMGGEWNTGATLVAETWPTELRAKAISIVQSSWAIGYAFAALVAGIVLHYADWRMVFFVGILPALVTLWIQSSVPESELWKQRRMEVKRESQSSQIRFADLFGRRYRRRTITLLLMNTFGMFGWWGLFTWIPPYL